MPNQPIAASFNLLFLVIKSAMTKALEFGICNLLSELTAHTHIVLSGFKSARAVTVLHGKTLSYCFDKLFIFVEVYLHFQRHLLLKGKFGFIFYRQSFIASERADLSCCESFYMSQRSLIYSISMKLILHLLSVQVNNYMMKIN